MKLTERFLRAKHWQLFLLTFGIPLVFQFVMMATIFASIGSGNEPDPSTFINFFSLFPILMIIYTGALFGWYWSVGIGLQSKMPANIKMKTRTFKVFFFIPMIYIMLFLVGFGLFINDLSGVVEAGEPPRPELIFGFMAIILPLHLFSMFCIFYCLYFVSKTLKTVELQRETTFSDFVGEFFLIWFYPIGIWIVQPKINKIAEHTPDLES